MEYEIKEFDRKISVLENLPTAVPTLSYEITETNNSACQLTENQMNTVGYHNDYDTRQTGVHMVS